MPSLDRLILYARDIAADPAAVLRILVILTGLYIALGLWAIFSGMGKTNKALAVKWSLTPNQLAALRAPVSGVTYRALNLAYTVGLFSGLLWGLCTLLAPRTRELPALAAWPALCVAITMVSLGAWTALYARSTLYDLALSRALSQHSPAEGMTVAGIAAGIDRHAVAKPAWQFRLIGVTLMLLPILEAGILVLRHILAGR